MSIIPEKSVDLIFADLPYGTTQNKWDSTIPLCDSIAYGLWYHYKKVLKPNGVIVLHGMELFSATLMLSNPDWYRYKWYWQKDRGTGHLNAKKMPLRDVEEILIFSPVNLGQFTYNPQMTEGEKCHTRGKAVGKTQEDFSRNNNYGSFKAVETEGNLKYPKTLLYFPRDKEKLHDTQKPVALAEYMIKTYTNEGDLILDNTCGSGITLVASQNLKRKSIGIELKEEFCEITKDRLIKVI
jgi:site-specific DNA-methyltransferase (adenine-specific)